MPPDTAHRRWRLEAVPEPPWPALAEPLEAYRRMTGEAAAARARLDQLERGRRAAVDADRRAIGAARRAGEPVPPATAVEEADRALAEARRELEGVEQGLADLAVEVRRLVGEHRAEWAADMVEAAEIARRSAEEALAALVGAHTRWRDVSAWVGWVASPEHGWRAHPGVVEALVQRSGEPTDAPSVLAALAEFYGPAPARPPAALPRLQEVTTEGEAA